MGLFMGVDIEQIVAQNLGAGGPAAVYSAVFTKVTPGTRSSSTPGTGTNPTTATYPCNAFAIDYSTYLRANNLVRAGELKVLIIAGTLALPAGVAPAPNDKIQITGDPLLGNSVAIVTERGVERDPAGATWILHCRRATPP
jgi:hypothetical protein